MSRKPALPKRVDENPEWTKADFAKARKFPTGVPLSKATAELMKTRGRPRLERPKEAIKLRIDADVLDAYRSKGSGWQTRINTDLRKASGLAKHRKTA
jgi:uncharacterized protein (DUF4415 family)